MLFALRPRLTRRLLLAGSIALAVSVTALGIAAVQTQRIAAEVELTIPPRGQFVELDGNRFHYVEQGEGPPILFLHGLNGSLLQFTEPLFGRLNGFRLVAVDRAGSGYSERMAAGLGIREQAAEMSGLIVRLGLGKPLVVGHSFGGAIALQLALDHPEQVAGLALLAPLARPRDGLLGEFKYLVIRPAPLRTLVAYTVGVPYAQRAYARGIDQFFGPQQAPQSYDTAGGGRLVLRPGALDNASTEAVALIDEPDLADMQSRFGELRMPVGVLFGRRDRLLTPSRELRRLREALPGMEVEVLPGVGHMVQYSEPAKTATFIRRMADKAFSAAPPD